MYDKVAGYNEDGLRNFLEEVASAGKRKDKGSLSPSVWVRHSLRRCYYHGQVLPDGVTDSTVTVLSSSLDEIEEEATFRETYSIVSMEIQYGMNHWVHLFSL